MGGSYQRKPNFELQNMESKKSAKVYMEIADNELSRARGLMFRSKIIPILFVFEKKGIFPIHSFFVKDFFDAVYLSKEGQVVEIFRRIPPNTPLVVPQKKADYLLELPCSIFDKLSIREGNMLCWRGI
ncbi:MAG: DUF192 domain-containing protein [Candidatus Anstonellaceae archaeon]